MTPENYDQHIVDEIYADIQKLSEMSYAENCFLNGLIRQAKPKKIVEIGVAAGGSTCVILNAIKDMPDAHLHSMDYNVDYYRGGGKKSGFLVGEKFPHLIGQLTFYAGGMSCNFLEQVGKDIDLCLIDTVHSNPGEFLDVLQVLPYMKKNGIIVFHDTALHTIMDAEMYTNAILLSVLKGRKITFFDSTRPITPNIGAVELADDAATNAFDVFNCLSLPWRYCISPKDYDDLLKHFSKHYAQDLTDIFTRAYLFYSARKTPSDEGFKDIQKKYRRARLLSKTPIKSVRKKYKAQKKMLGMLDGIRRQTEKLNK